MARRPPHHRLHFGPHGRWAQHLGTFDGAARFPDTEKHLLEFGDERPHQEGLTA